MHRKFTPFPPAAIIPLTRRTCEFHALASLLLGLFKAVSVSPRSNDSDGAPNDKAARFCALHAYLELHSAVAPPSLLAGNVSLMCMKIANKYPQAMGSSRARSLRKSMQQVFEHRLKLSYLKKYTEIVVTNCW